MRSEEEAKPKAIDKKRKEFNLNLLRFNQLKDNARICWPDPLDNKMESRMSMVQNIVTEEAKKYLNKVEINKKNCNPTLSNLMKEQRHGLKELKEMRGVIITETDKSKKLVAINEKLYDNKMDEHSRDKKITREEADKMEVVSRGHLKSMLRIFKIGESGNKQVERIEASLCTSKSSGANLTGMLKDHKEDMRKNGRST